MKTGPNGVALLKKWEGLKTRAYRDVAGIWTIGYGHTAAAGDPTPVEGMTLTPGECEAILKRDLAKFERRVNDLVDVPLSQDQFDTLVSFDFNTGALHRSTLLKRLNRGDYIGVPEELRKWVKAGGKTVPGLINRREAEVALWRSAMPPSVPSSPATKPAGNKAGNIIMAIFLALLALLGAYLGIR
jgi:lysozyme